MEENPVTVSEEEKEPEAQSEGKKPFNLKKELWEWAKAIVFAGVIVFLIFHFLIRVVSVDGSSMVPTLQNGDRLITSNLFYTPSYGDIVILSDNTGLDEALVKRVIAVAGQTVDINENGEVLVDGKVLSEPYIAETISDDAALRKTLRTLSRRGTCSSWATTGTTPPTAASKKWALSMKKRYWDG